jgi:hypothetical protein
MAISVLGRRKFLVGSAATATFGRAWGQRPDEAKLKRIAVMSWSFNSIIKSAARPDDPNRTIDPLDFADIMAQRYGIHYVELQHSHFASTEPAYLAEFRARLKKANSQMNQINVEFGQLNISATEPVRRLETIDLTKMWIDHAVTLGCPRVMINQGSLAPEMLPAAIETLKTITAYAKTKNVFITMENRGYGPPAPVSAATAAAPGAPGAAAPPRGSASWEVVVEVLKAGGAYANPDYQYFADKAAREAGLPVMYRMTSGSSHCKHDPEKYEAADCIKMAKAVGYKGLYSIETGRSNGPDPYVAAQTILDILLANI